jgi:Na+/H+ antiporter NhaC
MFNYNYDCYQIKYYAAYSTSVYSSILNMATSMKTWLSYDFDYSARGFSVTDYIKYYAYLCYLPSLDYIYIFTTIVILLSS